MEYRIKVIEYKNGNTSYIGEVKTSHGWQEIDRNGCVNELYNNETDNENVAIERINEHKKQNPDIKNISFKNI